jgi:hypothetical protein
MIKPQLNLLVTFMQLQIESQEAQVLIPALPLTVILGIDFFAL